MKVSQNVLKGLKNEIPERKNGLSELLSVIFTHLLDFIEHNFVSGGELSKPSKFNILLIIKSGRFLIKIVDMIVLYFKDYERFKNKYVYGQIKIKS